MDLVHGFYILINNHGTIASSLSGIIIYTSARHSQERKRAMSVSFPAINGLLKINENIKEKIERL
jgi:hypothetical protein